MDTTPIVASEAPDAELVEFLGGEAPKAPPTEPTAPAKPAAQPEATDGAQPRDATGKFTTTETPAVPAEAVEAPPETPPEPVPSTPFSYRAYGADHTPFPGAVVTPEGKVEFPPEAVPRLKQVLAEGHNAESRRRQAERDREAKLTSARSANINVVRKSEIALQRLAELRRNPDALQNWFQDLDRNWAVYEAEVERDVLQQELEAQRTAAQDALLKQQSEALRPQLRATLEKEVGAMIAAEPELGSLNAVEASERLWSAFFDRVFQEAEQDVPGQYRKGEILIDYDAIRAELQYEAKLRGAAKPSAPPKPAAPPAQKPPVAPPPVVATKGAGARPAPKVPTFKTTKDADEWFESGGYNEL